MNELELIQFTVICYIAVVITIMAFRQQNHK
jgi:hypothetical protein